MKILNFIFLILWGIIQFSIAMSLIAGSLYLVNLDTAWMSLASAPVMILSVWIINFIIFSKLKDYNRKEYSIKGAYANALTFLLLGIIWMIKAAPLFILSFIAAGAATGFLGVLVCHDIKFGKSFRYKK